MREREAPKYVGRFAPSPTGPLHFGSLVAAVASYLEAITNNGRWLVRIEDIDPPREQPGSTRSILDALQRYGFEWDGDAIMQSRSSDAHQAALQQLLEHQLAYPCSCSRRDLANLPRSTLGTIYPGLCRDGHDGDEFAIRVRTNDQPVRFIDRLQGGFEHRLEPESGDFIVQRRDGLIAYQLAVVVDDELQGVTHVVRGIDLLDSTPRQIWLQSLLGYTTPTYSHIPVITHPDGDKLSKLTGAPEISKVEVAENLFQALVVLMQRPPNKLRTAPLGDIWEWARHNWRIDRLFGNKAIVHAP